MRRGDFAAAWAVNDAVLAARDPATRDDPALPYHQRWVWDGTPPDGRDVLVRCYHGLGDTLQFSRYLPLLAARAARLVIEAQPGLCALLAGMAGTATVVPFHTAAPLPPAPCTLEIMEAGHVLRCVPPPAPVPARHPPGRPLRVGLCRAGGDWDRERSVASGIVGPLAAVPGIAWTCLRPGAPAGRFGPGLAPGLDVAGTAALVRSLDLVVTVDTMMAHLAGTLGVPGWVLLKAEPDWRWLPDATRSPWYPSLRLYRQPAAGAWQPVVAAVARDLRRAALVQTAPGGEFAAGSDLPGVPDVP